mmetsp:Transcript_7936/g.23643  ORF Transcript_7936/g.23643 Transcript_7936/m.23643 type:complete len:252 (+) Transcript_7936:601-1356(+)
MVASTWRACCGSRLGTTISSVLTTSPAVRRPMTPPVSRSSSVRSNARRRRGSTVSSSPSMWLATNSLKSPSTATARATAAAAPGSEASQAAAAAATAASAASSLAFSSSCSPESSSARTPSCASRSASAGSRRSSSAAAWLRNTAAYRSRRWRALGTLTASAPASSRLSKMDCISRRMARWMARISMSGSVTSCCSRGLDERSSELPRARRPGAGVGEAQLTMVRASAPRWSDGLVRMRVCGGAEIARSAI